MQRTRLGEALDSLVQGIATGKQVNEQRAAQRREEDMARALNNARIRELNSRSFEAQMPQMAADAYTNGVEGGMTFADAVMAPEVLAFIGKDNPGVYSFGQDDATVARFNAALNGGFSDDKRFSIDDRNNVFASEQEQARTLEAMEQAGLDRRNAADNDRALAVNRQSVDGQRALYLEGRLASGEPLTLADQVLLGSAPNLTEVKGGFAQDAIEGAGLGALNPSEQAFVGADQSAGLQVVTNPDGTMTVTQGGPAAGLDLTSSNKTNVNSALINIADFNALLDQAEATAMAAGPSAFGVAGGGRRVAQDVYGQARGLADAFGFENLEEGVNGVLSRLPARDQAGVPIDPRVYDPNLDELDKLSILLAYSAAGALANQTGRGLSNQDFNYFYKIVGKPTGVTMTMEKYLTGIGTMREQVARMAETRRSVLNLPEAAPAETTTAGAAPELEVGTVVDGYVYKGGDPNTPANWEPVQ